MGKRSPKTIVDKAAYSKIVDRCLDEMLEEENTQDAPSSSTTTDTPATTSKKEQVPIFTKPWFLALSLLSVLSVLVFFASGTTSDSALNPNEAKEKRQYVFKEDAAMVESIIEFMESDSEGLGAKNPNFRKEVDKLNSALAQDNPEDQSMTFKPEFFRFEGDALIYVEPN